MKKKINPIVPLMLGAILVVGFSVSSFDDPEGQRLFLDNCVKCHSVSTVEIKAEKETGKMFGGDLVNLGASYKAEFLNQYLRKEADLDGESHKKPFKGTDEELQALVDWLLEQKAEE